MRALVFALSILCDSRLQVLFGWLKEMDDEDTPFFGTNARWNVFSEDEKLLAFIFHRIPGFYDAPSLNEERDESIEDRLGEIFFESANMDILSDEGTYIGKTNGVTRCDFLSVRESREVNDLPVTSREGAYAGEGMISGHGRFLLDGEKRDYRYFRIFSVSGQVS